ncbi:hypothetical protein [Streptomyces sp. NPDC003077]|uniref:hypothetical protein n=1 Tax=Streptomyces sp. NPDC003077 TaxID=3154443 RepID=UPI0033A4E4C9
MFRRISSLSWARCLAAAGALTVLTATGAVADPVRQPGGVQALGAAFASANAARPVSSADAPKATAPRLSYDGPTSRIEVGGAVWFSGDHMPAVDKVIVTSPALVKPITLTPEKTGSTTFVQVNEPDEKPQLRSDIAPGSYQVSALVHGRTVATTRLTLVPEGSAVIGRFVVGPKDALPGIDTPSRVRPGSDATVLLTDRSPAPDEDELTVTSPLFDDPVVIRKDQDDPGCKCDDGATLYGGHSRVRDDIPAGTYPMKVTVHHGQETLTRQVVVAGQPVPRPFPWPAVGIAAAATVLIGAVAGWLLRHRRRETAAVSS